MKTRHFPKSKEDVGDFMKSIIPADLLDRMAACPQDRFWHSEGDVLTHTRMVCESAVELSEGLDSDDRTILILSAALHDIGKPAVTKDEDGRITSKGHSRIGAMMARPILRNAGFDFHITETVASLIARHQIPFNAIRSSDPGLDVMKCRIATDAVLLGLLARADNTGRMTTPEGLRKETFDAIELFDLMLSETQDTSESDPFSVFRHIESEGKFPMELAIHEHPVVHLTFGLPASGKSTWSSGTGLPVIGQDQARASKGMKFGKNEGKIAHEVREQAKEFLRNGQEFVWDGTHLTKQSREKHIDMIRSYGFYPVIEAFDCGLETAIARNSKRDSSLPNSTIREMFEKMDFPARHEAVFINVHDEAGNVSEWRPLGRPRELIRKRSPK